MMDREAQLRERDVRRGEQPLDPVSFLDFYVKSNFPQTAAIPSKEQREQGVVPPSEEKAVKLNKNPKSGTGFDNPAGY